MALPTTNLTFHVDASDTDKLWKTANGGGSGVHTNHPSNGEEVVIWDDEGDGSTTDVCITREGAGQGATWRSASSMLLPALDFDGSDDKMGLAKQDVSLPKAISTIVGASAKTVLVAFYPEVITGDAAFIYWNQTVFSDAVGYCCLVTRDVSGTKTLSASNNDGNNDICNVTIAVNRPWVACYRHDGSTLHLRVVDDALSVTDVSIASGATADLTNRFYLGQGNSSAAFFNGQVGELAAYNAFLTSTDLSDAVSYFTDKWLVAPGGGAIVPIAMHHMRQQGIA